MNLFQHRIALSKNPDAYTQDLDRVCSSAATVRLFKAAGYKHITAKADQAIIRRFVHFIFGAQDQLPFFYSEDKYGIPFCCNRPKDFKKDYIVYEWGHLHPAAKGQEKFGLENVCLQSARCNQHYQSGFDINEVIECFRGSSVANRAQENLELREARFRSRAWYDIKHYLAGCR